MNIKPLLLSALFSQYTAILVFFGTVRVYI